MKGSLSKWGIHWNFLNKSDFAASISMIFSSTFIKGTPYFNNVASDLLSKKDYFRTSTFYFMFTIFYDGNAQNRFCAIFDAIRLLAYTPWLYVIFRTCAQVTTILWHSYIGFKPSHLLQSNTEWRIYESRVNLHKRLVIKLYVYNSYAITTCVYSVHIQTLLLSSPSVYFQSMRREDCEKTSISGNFRGTNENLVEWCSYAFLTQMSCFYKIVIWWFLRPIIVITVYSMIFIDSSVVVVYNIIEKWMIYCYL